MNPDSQTPTQEPDENGGMPQVPTTGTGEDQAPVVPPTGGDEGGDALPEVPEVPVTPEVPAGDTPEAPAPEEGDKEDGAKW